MLCSKLFRRRLAPFFLGCTRLRKTASSPGKDTCTKVCYPSFACPLITYMSSSVTSASAPEKLAVDGMAGDGIDSHEHLTPDTGEGEQTSGARRTEPVLIDIVPH